MLVFLEKLSSIKRHSVGNCKLKEIISTHQSISRNVISHLLITRQPACQSTYHKPFVKFTIHAPANHMTYHPHAPANHRAYHPHTPTNHRTYHPHTPTNHRTYHPHTPTNHRTYHPHTPTNHRTYHPHTPTNHRTYHPHTPTNHRTYHPHAQANHRTYHPHALANHRTYHPHALANHKTSYKRVLSIHIHHLLFGQSDCHTYRIALTDAKWTVKYSVRSCRLHASVVRSPCRECIPCQVISVLSGPVRLQVLDMFETSNGRHRINMYGE